MAGINAENIGDYTHSEAPPVEEAPAEETTIEEEVSNEELNTEPANEEQEAEVSEERDPWNAEHLAGDDGLIAGKYKNVDAMVKSLEHAEAKLVELQAEKQSAAAKGKNAEKAEAAAAAVAEVENAGVQKYLESGREMTAELAAEITEAGGNATAVELQAIKAAQHMDRMTGLVGGEETFNQMITDMSEGKTDAQKQAWMKSVSDPTMSEYAIKGLHAEWLQQTGQRAAPNNGRISGKPSNQGSVKPYTTQAELTQASARARNDRGFRAEYEARKRVTPDSVFFGR